MIIGGYFCKLSLLTNTKISMAKLYLFKKPAPYKLVKEAFKLAVDEYLPNTLFTSEGDAYAWTHYLNYFINLEGIYITDRVSSIFYKEVGTYLELIALPNRTLMYLYDGIERVQTTVRIFDEYLLKGIIIVPEMKTLERDANKSYPNDEALAAFIKKVIDARLI